MVMYFRMMCFPKNWKISSNKDDINKVYVQDRDIPHSNKIRMYPIGIKSIIPENIVFSSDEYRKFLGGLKNKYFEQDLDNCFF